MEWSIRTRAEFDRLLATATNYEKSVDFHRGRVRADLERMRAYCERLGRPERAAPVIHVTGTKGKGSTASIAARILSAAASPVGLHTSPHLHRMEERIAVDFAPIDDAGLIEAMNDVLVARAAGPDPGFPTFFEFITLAAFLRFRRAGVRFAVHEVGLGGRLDATNVVQPAVTAITNVALEHTAVLGSTLEAIAAEKAGIVKPGAPVVTAIPAASPAFAVVERAAARAGVELLALGRDFSIERCDVGPAGALEVDLRTRRGTLTQLRPALAGEHQAENLAVAVQLAECLAEQGRVRLDPEAVRESVRGFGYAARFELLRTRPPVVIDGAHTAESVAAAVASVGRAWPGRRLIALFAMAEDKDIQRAAAALAPAHAVVATAYDHPRACAPDALAAHLRAAGIAVESAPTVEIGLARALDLAERDALVLVVGSLYLAGEVRARLLPSSDRTWRFPAEDATWNT